jgi:23S rRNA G2069 N7-methylase RlmK/C1962 C5-methylase RlmI
MTESTSARFPRLVLAKGREKSLLRRHPWVFSGAVSRMEGKARLGETIDIVDAQENGWRAAPFRQSHKFVLASGLSTKTRSLTSRSSLAACSRHSNGATGWHNATGWTAIASSQVNPMDYPVSPSTASAISWCYSC